MKPTHNIEDMRENEYLVAASLPWNLPKSCPEGSIPIRKVKSNDYLRANLSIGQWYKDPHHFLHQRGMDNHLTDDTHLPNEHSVIEANRGKYLGGQASISVWNPKVETKDELSASHIWLASNDKMVNLLAGWLVYPALYGDNRTRFFILWTTNGYKTFCYNLKCPGFVQLNRHIVLETLLEPVSVYGGPQYSVDIQIVKDTPTANWWVRLQGRLVGYWPKEVVPSFVHGADLVLFGGEVYNSRPRGQHTGTQMGSGHFSSEGFRKSSFFKNVKVLDDSKNVIDPGSPNVDIQSPKCYDVQVGSKKDGPWGYFFFYGGPGRSNQCT